MQAENFPTHNAAAMPCVSPPPPCHHLTRRETTSLRLLPAPGKTTFHLLRLRCRWNTGVLHISGLVFQFCTFLVLVVPQQSKGLILAKGHWEGRHAFQEFSHGISRKTSPEDIDDGAYRFQLFSSKNQIPSLSECPNSLNALNHQLMSQTYFWT